MTERPCLALSFTVLSLLLKCAFWSQVQGNVRKVEVSIAAPNGQLEVNQTLNFGRLIAFGFRTCSPGQILHQEGDSGDYVAVELLHSLAHVEIRWRILQVEIAKKLPLVIDNRWHNVVFRPTESKTVYFRVDQSEVELSDDTENVSFGNINLESSEPKLVIGNGFTGCLSLGVGLNLDHVINESDGLTNCPSAKTCENLVNRCSSRPCQNNGVCVSHTKDEYTCQCPKRYSGENCEIDDGPLCKDNGKCGANGLCKEDDIGNGTKCICHQMYTGELCELRIDETLCQRNPCKHDGVCYISRYQDGYKCNCSAGYTGVDCETDIDECSSSPCQNGGMCLDKVGNFACNCSDTGYTGELCEINIDECENEPCKNNSECVDLYGDFLCNCLPGFTGKFCQQEINECDSDPCENGGTCEDMVNRYQCHCSAGFEGANCQINIDDCANVTCPNFSSCVDLINMHACVCLPGYLGSPSNCVEVNECNSHPCHYGSTCIDLVNGFKCECPAGFSGILCDLNIDECQSNPCVNNGRCLDNVNGYTCECIPGFTGTDCEVNVDDCVNVACANGGTCVDLVNGYNCSCAKGWTGQLCSEDINECEFHPCVNGGQCRNLMGTFSCSCPSGFTGERCETNIDDCSPNPCHNGANCQDGVTNFTCVCPDQYMGRTCNEIYDACVAIGCNNGGKCTSSPPSHQHHCECLSGFEGSNCEINIDDCKHVECNNSQVCFDKVNEYECRCPDGFTGPECSINIDECNPNPCFNKSRCIDGIANFTCICPPGFEGHRCDEDIDECLSRPCNSGICVNSIGSYLCYCQPGFSGNTCAINFDECLSKPCLFNGTCEDLVNSYLCHCAPGYTGRNCETEIDECDSNPCRNNGTCEDRVNAYECRCVPGFTGINCETDIDECASTPCQNNGRCKDKINGFDCNCDDTGFKGEFCEINIDDCDPFPCTNDANCTDLVKDFRCECHYGYAGKICEIDINECADHPCLNEGLCLEKSNISLYHNNYLGLFAEPFSYSTAGGYVCHCVPGFRGENCSINIDDCDPYPCFNGTCVDGINNYTCDCFHGFEGRHCEVEIDECDRYHPCRNGSTCRNTVGDYECKCLPSFGGKNCSIELMGCVNNDCQNGATCIPYLVGETEHRYNCTCPPGFYGRNCEHITTFSLLGNSSYFMDSPVNDEYQLTFQFRTTLPEGLLAFSKNGSHMFVIGIVNGMLHFQINTFEDVVQFEKPVNDALWHTLKVIIASTQVQMKLIDREVELEKTFNVSGTDVWKFHRTYLGSSVEIERHGFVGCMQDIIINGIALVPSLASKAANNIEMGCARTDQCDPDPCSARGTCTDLWRSFHCACHRPYLGKLCNYSYVPATFGYEKEVSSAILNLSPEDQTLLQEKLNISLFIRTRKADGLILYFGQRGPNEDDSFLALELSDGRLKVVTQFQGNLLQVPSSSVRYPRLDDGNYHLLTLAMQRLNLGSSTKSILLYINSTVIVNASLDIGDWRLSRLFLGSLPYSHLKKRQTPTFSHPFSFESSSRPMTFPDNANFFVDWTTQHPHPIFESNRPQDANSENDRHRISDRLDSSAVSMPDDTISENNHFSSRDSLPVMSEMLHPTESAFSPTNLVSPVTLVPFKGILRDIRLNNKRVILHSQNIPEVRSLPAYDRRVMSLDKVREGVVGDPVCAVNPCQNGGVCVELFNFYKCSCVPEYRGRNCTLINYCHGNSCPENSECNPLDDGYECISNGTFDGKSSRATYKAAVSPNTSLDSLSFHFRTQRSGIIMQIENTQLGFTITVHVRESQLIVERSVSAGRDSVDPLVFASNATDGDWHVVEVIFGAKTTTGTFDEENVSINTTDASDISDVIKSSIVHVGSAENSDYPYYRGCLREIRIGGVLLPFHDNKAANFSSQYFVSESLTNVNTSACILCYEFECANHGVCSSPEINFGCNCSVGFEGQYCTVDIDECEPSPCVNGRCIDMPGYFNCICEPGYTGKRCDVDIDECLFPDTCHNGGTCINLEGSFKCSCNSNYTGPDCNDLVSMTCDHSPCQHVGTCDPFESNDPYYKFRCFCTAGYVGKQCESAIDFCESKPCIQGHCYNLPEIASYNCTCEAGFTGTDCDININECESFPCQYNATCIDGINGFECKCKQGYKGEFCQLDVNECVEDELACSNLTSYNCTNFIGSYKCYCQDGYIGKNCSYEDPCDDIEMPVCLNDGICIPDADGENELLYFCDCRGNYGGVNCTEEMMIDDSLDAGSLAIIIAPIVGVTLLIVMIALMVFFMMARKKRATRGTYSPSRQEMFGSRVEMGHVMKRPPEERLI